LEDEKRKGALEGEPGAREAVGARKFTALAPGQRWTVARKRDAVLRLLRGEPVEMLSRELGVEIYRLEQWREKALRGIDSILRERSGDPLQAELDTAMRRIGELTMENELLWKKTGRPGPLPLKRSRR
jgi:hypothetical protein